MTFLFMGGGDRGADRYCASRSSRGVTGNEHDDILCARRISRAGVANKKFKLVTCGLEEWVGGT